MSQENSILIDQHELASQYRRYADSKSRKGPIRFLLKTVLIPGFVLLLILIGAAFATANLSPSTYTQAKDIIFANIDVEKLTGLPDSQAREYLDNWLVVNSNKQQEIEIAKEGAVQEDQMESAINPNQ